MSPPSSLNRGPLLGTRMPLAGMRPPLPRFGGRLPPPGMPPMRMPPPLGGMFPPMRQRMPPPRPGRPGTIMRPGGPPPMFGPRIGCGPPMGPPMMGPRGPRGPPLRPGPRGMPPHMLMRPRFPQGNNAIRNKGIIPKKASKLEELELKKPWMTDAIRSEVQRKNKLYTKARKSKDAKEWENFKDLRNKVTRMIRDAKNEYLEKNPENKTPVKKPDETSTQEATEGQEKSPAQKATPSQEGILTQESVKVEEVQDSAQEQNQVQNQETVQLVAAQN